MPDFPSVLADTFSYGKPNFSPRAQLCRFHAAPQAVERGGEFWLCLKINFQENRQYTMRRIITKLNPRSDLKNL
jgi:hypothetical protein